MADTATLPLPHEPSNPADASTSARIHALTGSNGQSNSDSPNSHSKNSSTARPARSNAPVTDVHGRILNPRSCVTCRRRKVKCDKLHPCSNCNRAHIECVFPTPGRAPRKVRKSGDGRDAELLARLRRLEGVVKGLGVNVEKDEPEVTMVATNDTPPSDDRDSPKEERSRNETLREKKEAASCPHGARTNAVDTSKMGAFENRFGRLVVNEGKSRYINNSFWASLSNEVEDLKGILNEASDDEEDGSPGSGQHIPDHHQGWVFSFSSQNVDLLSLHPIPMQIETYWRIYKENVDPLVKVLHIPSLEPTILAAASHLANLSKSFEALLFAIYYGVTTSLSAEDCLSTLGEERSVLLSRYRFALEQALARANFLTTEEIVVLQALVIFLICLRRNSDARVIWTLTGLVVRISQTMGIHRDGSHFGLPPFAIEMRRRLWWQICILDVRASEDHGCDPTIIEQTFDTKLPMNINDADIEPGMEDFPPERQGMTDCTFCLIRFEVANTFRRLNYVPPGNPRQCGDYFASVSHEDKERWITDCHRRLEDRYLKHADMSIPMNWVTATVARLMMSKMWLMVYHPFQRQNAGASLSDETRDRLFITSLENIEYSLLLETEARTMKWGWLFRTYMQWHALAFMLSELCHRIRGDLVERAWIAVDKTRDGRWRETTGASIQGHLWRPLLKLITRAREARNQAVREDAGMGEAHEKSRSQSADSSTMMLGMNHAGVKPRMTRAPLSQAQIQRFMTPPTYGTQPIDSTALLQSPKIRELLQDDLMDTSTIPAELLHDSLIQPVPPPTGNNDDFNFANSTQPNFGLQPPSWRQQSQNNDLNTNTNGTGNDIPASNPNFPGLAMPTSTTSPVTLENGTTSWDASNPAGLSPFENNGNLDWATWDQLVRQFGIDVDQNAEGGQAANWAGPDWMRMSNLGSSQMGMGMGMGGNWF